MTDAETERAAIVAWLRERAVFEAYFGRQVPPAEYGNLADAIERGDHTETSHEQ